MVGAAIGAVVGGGSAINSMRKQNRSTVAAFKKRMQYLQMNYNYNQAALDRQERSMYDNALGELFALSLNAYQNNAQIEAAIAETGLEGRSQEKIGQVVKGQTERQETATKEAYMMGVWDVRSQKDALYIQTKASVEQAKDNLDNSLIYGSRAFLQFLNGAAMGAAMGAATGGAAGGALGGQTGGALGGQTGGKMGGMLAANVGVDAISRASPTVTEATASNTGGSFLGNAVANFKQYKPYVDFVQQWANFFNQDAQYRQQRGGYFY